jgi:hypothetical protein
MWFLNVMYEFEEKIDFLKSLGCDSVKHSNQTLLSHLIGVHDLLKEWNAPEYLQDAGLFHSVYGTTYFKPKMTVDRNAVRELIGGHAEALAAIFCFMPHPRLVGINNEENEMIRNDLILLNSANVEDMSSSNMMTWEEAYNDGEIK